MTPESVTLAIDALELNHVIVRFAKVAPLASLAVATPRAVCPATREVGSLTRSEATATCVFSTETTEVPYEEHAVTLNTRPVTASMKVRIGCALLCSVIRRLDWHGV